MRLQPGAILLVMVALPLLVVFSTRQFRSVATDARMSTATSLPMTDPTATPRLLTATPAATATATPAPTRTPRPGRMAVAGPEYVPVLMYHYIRVADENADPVGYRLSILPERFAEQMAWLQEHAYTPMRMDDLAACLRGQQDCPDQPVALTFDDGYADAATEALPILNAYGFKATFYIVPGFVGRPGYMSWEQIELLHNSGMEIGSHTMNHADLTGLEDVKAIRNELVQSREVLEQRLGAPVRSFCYPAGSYAPQIMEEVRRAGYTNAVITAPGDQIGNLYEIPRRRVLGGETIAGFPWYMLPVE